MPSGQRRWHDHDLDEHCRAHEFVERSGCYARASYCSVVPDAVAMSLFVQRLVKSSNLLGYSTNLDPQLFFVFLHA